MIDFIFQLISITQHPIVDMYFLVNRYYSFFMTHFYLKREMAIALEGRRECAHKYTKMCAVHGQLPLLAYLMTYAMNPRELGTAEVDHVMDRHKSY